MALCESKLDSIHQIQQDQEDNDSKPETARSDSDTNPVQNGIYGPVNPALPLTVDYRSPVSHFIPPVVEMMDHITSQHIITREPPAADGPSPSPSEAVQKRKRGRPRIDKTSPEYLARYQLKKQQREIEAATRGDSGTPRKRGRPRVDKTSPEYLARRRQRELEALEKKARKQYKRRATGESASSSAGESPKVKRKYTRRPGSKPGRPRKEPQPGAAEKVKGKRGRPRKDPNSTQHHHQHARIRVRNNLMPNHSTETITIDSDDDLGSPSESLSLDENLRALRSIHEKYAHLQNNSHRLADIPNADSEDGPQVEKLEDSSNSDSDSSTSSGSSSSSSNSSTSSSSSSDSSSSDSEGEKENDTQEKEPENATKERRSSESSVSSLSGGGVPTPESISESENESVDKTYQCHICFKWYSTIVTLKIHRRGHQNRSASSRPRSRQPARYSCDTCPATFSRREKLHIHQSEVHRGAMTLKCGVCGRAFEDEDELRDHDLTHTDTERQGRCSLCPAQFANPALLSKHVSAAHPGPLPSCTLCGKTFHHHHSLTRHMQNHQRQMYRCVVCKASFARADQLAQHLNSHLATYKRLKP